MGTDKLLLEIAGHPLHQHAAKALAEGGYDQQLVVVTSNAGGRTVKEQLAELGFCAVHTSTGKPGLLSSFQAAARVLVKRRSLVAATFALADMPLVQAEHHRKLIRTFHQTRAAAVLSRYDGVVAPPHLFRADLLPELLALRPADRGPRELLERHRDDTAFVEQPADTLLDVDTPDDLIRATLLLQARAGGGASPGS